MMNNPIVRLWHSSGLGVILLCKSGIRYTNQTGGYACLHPDAEGVYVPLNDSMWGMENALNKYFTGPKLGGWCHEGIDEETASDIDSLLRKSHLTERLSVDRDRLTDSHEAWIHVNIAPKEDSEYTQYAGVDTDKGILTWENSD